jgi:anti-sigma regulatory factor (Ser/Thr protein kinase)
VLAHPVLDSLGLIEKLDVVCSAQVPDAMQGSIRRSHGAHLTAIGPSAASPSLVRGWIHLATATSSSGGWRGLHTEARARRSGTGRTGARVALHAVAMLELRLAPRMTAPATARSELTELPLGESDREAVLLLASELVTNCVRHAGLGSRQRIGLRAHVTDHAVRVEVIDSGTSFGVAMRRPDATGGWGLCLVDRIADRWGVIGDVGAHVWFELDRTDPLSGSAHRASGKTASGGDPLDDRVLQTS